MLGPSIEEPTPKRRVRTLLLLLAATISAICVSCIARDDGEDGIDEGTGLPYGGEVSLWYHHRDEDSYSDGYAELYTSYEPLDSPYSAEESGLLTLLQTISTDACANWASVLPWSVSVEQEDGVSTIKLTGPTSVTLESTETDPGEFHGVEPGTEPFPVGAYDVRIGHESTWEGALRQPASPHPVALVGTDLTWTPTDADFAFLWVEGGLDLLYACSLVDDGSFTIPPAVLSSFGETTYVSVTAYNVSTRARKGRRVELVGSSEADANLP